ncbi:MAG: prolyl oligopeptidase family serine peptidase [Planctomycetota bacterium]|nr:prolyl oligopeptidase family serine peptidase [Planctomycetota bacterium]
MNTHRIHMLLAVLTLVTGSGLASSQDPIFKRALDHDVYDSWNSIGGSAISNDGDWILYRLQPGDPEANGTLKIRPIDDETRYVVERGASAKFTFDSKHAVYLVTPDKDEIKKLSKQFKKDKVKDIDDRLPKSKLEFITLSSSEIVTIDRVKSYRLPEKAGGWLAYLLEKPIEEDDTETEAETEEGEEEVEGETEAEPETMPEEEVKEEPEEEDEKKKDPGTTLVLRNLITGAEQRFENVLEYAFSEDGASLAFTTSVDKDDDPSGDGVFVVDTATGHATQIMSGLGHYVKLAIDKPGVNFAFLSDRDTYEDHQPEFRLYHYTKDMDEAASIAAMGDQGIPEDWWVSENGSLSFSETGARLFFGTAPRPEPDKTDEEKEALEDEEKPVLDIWHWQDDRLMTQQLVELEEDRDRTYRAVYHVADTSIVQLANVSMPNVSVSNKGDGDVAMASTNMPYRMQISWDTPSYRDIHLIDVRTGSRELVVEKLQTFVTQLSPQGKYVLWWDGHVRHWFAMNTKTRKIANLTELLPHPVENILHDTPAIPGPAGMAGWLEDDQGVLLYDTYDVWLANPEGFHPPACVTDGYGRENDLRLRYIYLEPEEDFIDSESPMLLGAFNLVTKASGFMRDVPRGTEPPTGLIMGDESFGRPRKAEESDTLLLTRETYKDFPNLWVCDFELKNLTQLSDANPQQAQYRWGSAELIEWTSSDGQTLQGIVYKPEDFDPTRKYPMMTYFYERSSNGLHRHNAPEPHRSVINKTFYTSRGYVVFVPDIPYINGYPGQSAMNAIMPGVQKLIETGYIDAKKIGVQGHSWGGYQIAYMVTRTDLFACAEAGAPVSNMTSAYGGIRWDSGLSRMFQYEKTQSRIDGTLWNAQQRYIENSPIFWADRINTPLLIMHNDHDGHVPWYQGIELFVAMRRLGKPSWLINYNDQPHWPITWPNKKDWAKRMQQYFDHYLLDAPAPRWLAEGLPAIEKGKELGYELMGEELSTEKQE